MTHILLRDLDVPDIWQFDTYVNNGGYEGLKKQLDLLRLRLFKL